MWKITSVLFAILAALFAMLTILTTCMYYDTYTRLRKVENDTERLLPLVKEHDDIMMTYKFFNEHWSAIMQGE